MILIKFCISHADLMFLLFVLLVHYLSYNVAILITDNLVDVVLFLEMLSCLYVSKLLTEDPLFCIVFSASFTGFNNFEDFLVEFRVCFTLLL